MMAKCKEPPCDMMDGICCMECEIAPMCPSTCELVGRGIEEPGDCSEYIMPKEAHQLTVDEMLEIMKETGKKYENICMDYEKAGMKRQIARTVIAMLAPQNTEKDVRVALDIIMYHKQDAANVQEMLKDGIPIMVIRAILPYLDKPSSEIIEIRRERFGCEVEGD